MTENDTTGAPTALPELNDATITRLAAAWGVSPAEARAQYETAREAVAAQAEEDEARRDWEKSERQAFSQWFENQAFPISVSEHALWLAWLGRACIAAEYEARVDAETREAMDVTSEQVNGFMAEALRLKEELAAARFELHRAQEERNRLAAHVVKIEAENAKLRHPVIISGCGGSVRIDGKIQVDGATTNRVSNARAGFTEAVLREVAAERVAQFNKWGTQRWPLLPLTNGITPQRAGCLGIVSSLVAKDRCKRAFDAGIGTFGHILVKEVSEAIDAPTLDEMRAELIQVAAVAVQMVEVIGAGNNPDG